MKKICVVLLFVAASAFGQTFPVMTQLPTGAPALAASNSSSFTFVVAGDNRPAHDGDPLTTPLLDIVKQLAATPPAFVVWGGDTVYGKQDIGIDAQYAQFLAALKPVPVPVFNAPGNHEMVVQTDGRVRDGQRSVQRRAARLQRLDDGQLSEGYGPAVRHVPLRQRGLPPHQYG